MACSPQSPCPLPVLRRNYYYKADKTTTANGNRELIVFVRELKPDHETRDLLGRARIDLQWMY